MSWGLHSVGYTAFLHTSVYQKYSYNRNCIGCNASFLAPAGLSCFSYYVAHVCKISSAPLHKKSNRPWTWVTTSDITCTLSCLCDSGVSRGLCPGCRRVCWQLTALLFTSVQLTVADRGLLKVIWQRTATNQSVHEADHLSFLLYSFLQQQ